MNPTLRTALFSLALATALAPGRPLAAQDATQPAAAPATRPANPLVLVLPIAPPEGSYAWVGKAIQQDIMVDLQQMTRARVIAPSVAPAADADAALRAARDANADYVAFGNAQVLGSQLRVTGQVLDARTGQSVSPLKVTAPVDNLFPLEDALAAQAARAISPTSTAALPTDPDAYVRAQPSQPPAPMPQVTTGPQYESVPAYVPSYYTESPGGYAAAPYPYYYSPGYYYPGYLAYGWWGPGVVIVRNHWHGNVDHGFDHRLFVSPHVNPGIYNRGAAGFGRAGARGGFGGGARMGGFRDGGGAQVGGGGARGR